MPEKKNCVEQKDCRIKIYGQSYFGLDNNWSIASKECLTDLQSHVESPSFLSSIKSSAVLDHLLAFLKISQIFI